MNFGFLSKLLVAVVMVVPASLFAQQTRYTTINEFGFIDYSLLPLRKNISAQTFHGVRVNEKYSIGASIGLESYRPESEGDNIWMLPVAVGGKYILTPHRKNSFYAGVDLGYGFSGLNKEVYTEGVERISFEGGRMMHPHIGFRFYSRNRKLFLTTNLGYKVQTVKRRYEYNFVSGWWTPVVTNTSRDFAYVEEKKFTMHRLSLRVGVGF